MGCGGRLNLKAAATPIRRAFTYSQGLKRQVRASGLSREILTSDAFQQGFVTPLVEILLESGSVTLTTRRIGQANSLMVVPKDGAGLAFSDPLKLADKMSAREIVIIAFTDEVEDGYAEITSVLEALFDPDESLPEFAGVVYEKGSAQPPVVSPPRRPIQVSEWRKMVGTAETAEQVDAVLAVFRARVLPFVPAEQVDKNNVPPLMVCARRMNEEQNDIASAAKIWRAIIDADLDPERNRRTYFVMVNVANQKSDLRKAKAERDINGALVIWKELLKIDPEEYDIQDASTGLVKAAMLMVASTYSDHTKLKQEREINVAIAIWLTILREPNLDADTHRQILLTMMDVANKLNGTDTPERDLASSLRVLTALLGEDLPAVEKLITVLTAADILTRSRDLLVSSNPAHYHLVVGESKYMDYIWASVLYTRREFAGALSFIESSSFKDETLLSHARVDNLLKLAHIHDDPTRYEEGVRICDEAIARLDVDATPEHQRLFPFLATARVYCVADLARKQGRPLDEALADIERIIEFSARKDIPFQPRLLMLKVYLLMEQGKTRESLALAQHVYETYARNPKAAAFLRRFR